MNNNSLRSRFDNEGYSVVKYAEKVNRIYKDKNIVVSHTDVTLVLDGKRSGTQMKRNGVLTNVQAVITVLKGDGVWTDELPWEMKRSS